MVRVQLEAPALQHATQFLAAVRRSRTLHARWVTPPATRAEYRAFVQRFRAPTHMGHFVCTSEGELAGVNNVNEMVRGAFRSAYLGYYALAPYGGGGYMRAGLCLVLQRAFRRYGLHRLEANIQPDNQRSIALIKSLGFRLEGFSPRYLKIRGRWRDHERWAITAEEWSVTRPGRRG